MVSRFKRGLRIEWIKAHNFKNFKDLNVSLDDFNVVIGANSSGKSNFIQIFNFLKHIAVHSLDNAISMQGGAEYLVNFDQQDKTIWIEVMFKAVGRPPRIRVPMGRRIGFIRCKYTFEIRLEGQARSDIISDKLRLDLVSVASGNIDPEEVIGHLTIEKGEDGERHIDVKVDGKKRKLKHPIFRDIWERRQFLILEDHAITRYLISDISHFFYSSNVYDFDLKAAKSASTIKGMAGLENNGSNLAVVLKNTLQIKDARKSFLNFLIDFFPFVESIDIKQSLDNSFVFTVKEKYFKQTPLPATLISDGTASIAAIILALYFERNELSVFEEPERSIHPGMILRLVETFKDASNISQIIVTTHNPELLRHVDIENIFTVTRNDIGESKIIKPKNLEVVKQFLDEDMGVEDLFVQKLLGD